MNDMEIIMAMEHRKELIEDMNRIKKARQARLQKTGKGRGFLHPFFTHVFSHARSSIRRNNRYCCMYREKYNSCIY